MSVNKVVYGSTVLIDLTADTVTADKILSSYTAHDASGASITGACTYDSDTTDATVKVAEMLTGKTAYARGTKLTGTMPNNGAVAGVISDASESYTIAQGYHDGSGTVSVDTTNLSASNIREGVEILGVTGTMSAGEGITSQAKTATPSTQSQVITPDTGYTYLSQVTVAAIPYAESTNSAGGTTVTIG